MVDHYYKTAGSWDTFISVDHNPVATIQQGRDEDDAMKRYGKQHRTFFGAEVSIKPNGGAVTVNYRNRAACRDGNEAVPVEVIGRLRHSASTVVYSAVRREFDSFSTNVFVLSWRQTMKINKKQGTDYNKPAAAAPPFPHISS